MPRVNITLSKGDYAALSWLAERGSGGNRSLAVRRLIEPELSKVRQLLADAAAGQLFADQGALFEGPGSGGNAAETRTPRRRRG